jgi:hypothetical protein
MGNSSGHEHRDIEISDGAESRVDAKFQIGLANRRPSPKRFVRYKRNPAFGHKESLSPKSGFVCRKFVNLPFCFFKLFTKCFAGLQNAGLL